MLEFRGKMIVEVQVQEYLKIEVRLWIRDIKLIFAAGYYID
jgi:hypothetical protein